MDYGFQFGFAGDPSIVSLRQWWKLSGARREIDGYLVIVRLR
jgi:hypothetical protein